ncbi:4-amino-4-deoxychorismate lyase [Pseudoclavibacter endophyticus]|nr:aminotransferase class IV [Pseudoclavibacter endophyticus]GGA75502.1 4-amino-4-deoxychorismate lyase [Pseudoclavibacter endophyticus]
MVTSSRLLALLDGSLIDPATPIVHADDLGVVRGDGVFETLLAIDGEPRDLEPHLERLAASAKLLSLPVPDAAGYRRAIAAVLGAWPWADAQEALVRIVQTRGRDVGRGPGSELDPPDAGGPGGWALAFPLSPAVVRQRSAGVRVLLLDRGFEGDEIAPLPWLLPGAKTLSYGVNMAAGRYAAANGADDAIFVSPSGNILEGPTSGVVVDLDGELVTPPLAGILDSITVAHLRREGPAAGLALRTREVTRQELLAARGAWLLSSGRIAAPVVSIDGEPFRVSPLHERLAAVLRVPGAAGASPA